MFSGESRDVSSQSSFLFRLKRNRKEKQCLDLSRGQKREGGRTGPCSQFKEKSAKSTDTPPARRRRGICMSLSSFPALKHPRIPHTGIHGVLRMSNDVDHPATTSVGAAPTPQLPAIILFLLLSSVLFLCIVSDVERDGRGKEDNVRCVCVCLYVCVASAKGAGLAACGPASHWVPPSPCSLTSEAASLFWRPSHTYQHTHTLHSL